ncbi:MAG: M36 family metallopeptidase [Pseudomonadota bacterium]
MPAKSVHQPLEVGTFDYEWGQWYYTPKEMWNFSRQGSPAATPESVARDFLKANHLLFGLQRNLASLKHDITARGLAGYHVVFRQFVGRKKSRSPLAGAIVSVHMTNRRLVYMCKNRAMPHHQALSVAKNSSTDYVLPERRAKAFARDVLKNPDSEYLESFARIARDKIKVRDAKRIWWPRAQGQIMSPAWKIKLMVEDPVEEWNIVLSAPNRKIIEVLEISNNGVSYASKFRHTGKADLFDPNPVIRAGAEKLVKDFEVFRNRSFNHGEFRNNLHRVPESAYVRVRLQGLDDSGHLNGRRVKVNVSHGKSRVRRAKRDFTDIRARDGNGPRTGFEELMVYHHADRAIARIEKMGYRGDKRIFRKPLLANVYWSNVDGSAYDGAWYNHPDQQLCFGEGEVSDAEDGETIVHEVGHAIQDHIVNNFGQSAEAGAMGEGFSDYYAMSHFEKSKPVDYRKTVMSWDGIVTGLEWDIDPPCQRHIHSGFYGELNYENFVVGEDAWKHTNGLIWTATLWDIHEALEAKVAERIIVESHFELSPHTSMPRGARAIIHADRNLNGGKHEDKLIEIFEKRGFPPYAYRTPSFRTHAEYEMEYDVVTHAKSNPHHGENRLARDLDLTETRQPRKPIEMPVTPERIRKMLSRHGISHPRDQIVEVLFKGKWRRARVVMREYNDLLVRFVGQKNYTLTRIHHAKTRQTT